MGFTVHSQPHKHLQLIPLPFDGKFEGFDFPMEVLLQKNAEGVKEGEIFEVKELPFKHACLRVPSSLSEPTEELERLYNALYSKMGVTEGMSYNFLMTPKWMMLVLRSQENYCGLSVNSVGFAGTLLVKSDEQRKTLQEIGPMQLLKNVAVPK